MKPRNQITTKSAIASALMHAFTETCLPDQFVVRQALVGQNFMGRLRSGATYDLPSLERVARVLGYRLKLERIPSRQQTAEDKQFAAEREAARKMTPTYAVPMTPQQREDYRNMMRKDFRRDEAISMLGLDDAA